MLLMAVTTVHAEEKAGPLTGTIVSRDSAANTLTVAHQDVPGIMGAMTMPYDVRGQRVSELPSDGSAITATLHLSQGTYWLTDVMSTSMMSSSADDLLMRQASGTSMNPAAAPMHMEMWHEHPWMLMLHGAAFINHVEQTGPRGGDKFFSTNWIMGMASRPLAGGTLMFRSMLSLEPATVGDEYPELFQTGETLHGRPIVDAQHPHDFFMEVAAEYAHPLSANTIAYVYAAPFGDPSLGPVAYPHRASASELPQGTLSHHLQDSTHVAGSVITIGAQSGKLGCSVSGFHGREPDENRWDIDTGKLDSWAARISFDPTPHWTAQVSTGHLEHPEALEPGNVQRTTASVSYSDTRVDASAIYGHNDKSEGAAGNSWVAEGVYRFGGVNYITGRAEVVDKDELFDDGVVHRIKALTIGYTRDIARTAPFRVAVGSNVTVYSIPDSIKADYGSPHSLYFFLRLRLE